MNKILKDNEISIGITLAIIGCIILFFPVTYYGYIEYVINNSVQLISSDQVTLDVKNAAVHLYNGHPIKEIDYLILLMLSFVGCFVLYVSAFFITMRSEKLMLIFTKKYWFNFRPLP